MMMPLLRCASSLFDLRLMTSKKTLDNNNTKLEKEKTLKFTTKIIVLGTNHTSSSDAEKVTRIIEDEKPDVVVVELDFERLNSNSNSYKIGRRANNQNGKDFMNAEIPEMLLSKATSVENVVPERVFGGIAYFLESFKDTFGVAPTASVLTITLACALVDNNFVELFVLLYGVSVVSEVLLKDRDVVLAENVLKGVDIAKRLRKKELLSKQFTFYSSPSSDDVFLDEENDTAIEESQLPVFTLKRPFKSRDEIRRLNLFEPRWLRMLDEIAKRNEGSLVGAKLGVVLAQNRLYTPENFNDEDDDNKNVDIQTEKKRVARIVFDPFVRRAKVVDAKESTRPVTGARKVEVFIALDSEANDDFVGEFREAPGQRGYMLASPKKLADERVDGMSSSKTSSEEEKEEEESKIKCVVVCGKLHVRGVVSRLQQGGNINNSRSGSSSSSSSSSSSRDSDSGVVIVTM
ncbi:unnamed protein product [Bathycoccus prasinos]